jgi:hypothetical protein
MQLWYLMHFFFFVSFSCYPTEQWWGGGVSHHFILPILSFHYETETFVYVAHYHSWLHLAKQFHLVLKFSLAVRRSVHIRRVGTWEGVRKRAECVRVQLDRRLLGTVIRFINPSFFGLKLLLFNIFFFLFFFSFAVQSGLTTSVTHIYFFFFK